MNRLKPIIVPVTLSSLHVFQYYILTVTIEELRCGFAVQDYLYWYCTYLIRDFALCCFIVFLLLLGGCCFFVRWVDDNVGQADVGKVVFVYVMGGCVNKLDNKTLSRLICSSKHGKTLQPQISATNITS